jgi:hypothetical protein
MFFINNTLKKILGVILIITGLILHLIPLFPAAWIIVIGLELLGLRILFQKKIKYFLSKFKQNQKNNL